MGVFNVGDWLYPDISQGRKPQFGQERLKQGHPLNQGLVGWWLMNEGGGLKAYDLSGNGNHGTLTNGPTWTTGKFGQAINFDGVDDYVLVPTDNGFSDKTNGSISVWFYATTMPNLSFLFRSGQSSADTPCIYSDGTNLYSHVAYSDLAIGTVASLVGKWHHVVVTWTNSNRIVYLDGNAGNSGAGPYGWGTGWHIGSNNAHNFNWNGSIDEVRIYNRALSAGEVQSLYSDPLAALDPPPIDIWVPSAGGGTSIALTGVAGTGAVGNVTTALSVPLTGTAGTGAVGNITTALSRSITGTAGTGAVGTVTTALSVPLTNVVGTGAAGTITTALSVALTGVTSTGAAGTVTPSAGTSIALTGVAGTGAGGSLTTTLSTSVTGVLGTGAVGTVYPGAVMALTGVAGTGAVGSVATTVATALTGAAGTGAVGNLTTALSRSITGTAGTGAVGSVVPGGTVINLTGVAATGAVNTFTSTLATQLNGIYAPGLVGNVSYAGAPALVVLPPGFTFVASTWQETRVASVRSETSL